jgi:putative ABC transport system permease protein
VNLAPGTGDEEARDRIENEVPGVMFHSGRWIREMINRIAYAALAVESAIALAALLLACLGVGNVMAASLHGRRFEYGVMRAVGAPRSVLLRLVLAEAALMAVAGAVAGTGLGLHLAWVSTILHRDLVGLELSVAIPTLPTAIGWLVLIVLTLLATLPGALAIILRRPAVLISARRAG